MKKLSLLSLILSILIFTNCGSDDGGGIQIDPLSLDFSDSELTVDESAGTQTITVALGETAAISGTFTITLGGTATYGDDYTTLPAAEDGVIAISVEEGDASKEITVMIVDDTELEVDETIELTIATDIEELELGTNTSATITLTSNDQALVAIERASGQMYMIDLTNGAQTDLLAITGVTSSDMNFRANEEESANIRSFIYDPATDKGYVGQNYNGGSKIYSVNMGTGAATEIFANDEEDFYLEGILDFFLDGETLYGASYYADYSSEARTDISIEEPTSGHSYYQINKSTGEISERKLLEPDYYVGGGALFVDNDTDMVYYTFRWYEDEVEEAYGSALMAYDLAEDTKAGTYWSSDDVAEFEDDSETFELDNVAVQTFAVNDDGEVYAVLSTSDEGSSGAWYLATVDLENAKLGYVTMLTDVKTEQVQAIGFLPEEVVLGLLEE